MRKLILKLLSLFSKRRDANPVIQDMIRMAIRKMLTEKFGKDVEEVALERMKQQTTK
jgi:hypothetical protein